MVRVGRFGVVAAVFVACSGSSLRNEPSSESDCEAWEECEPQGGAGPGTTGGSGATAAAGGTAGTGASSGGVSGTGVSQGGSSGEGGMTGEAGEAGRGGFTNVGVCGERGEALVSATRFSGTAEMYLFSEEDAAQNRFESPLCLVSFHAERVGDAPAGCMGGFEGVCQWSHLVELQDPRVLVDVDGVCASHELGLDAARLASLDGSRVSLGYFTSYGGHSDVIMRYDDVSGTWIEWGPAFHDLQTGVMTYDARFGFCGY